MRANLVLLSKCSEKDSEVVNDVTYFAAKLSEPALNALRAHKEVEYIEEDAIVTLDD